MTFRPRTSRHFPSPWRADKTPGGYVVRDANDQALAYIYSRENEADALQFKELTSGEARRIAMVFARLPELVSAALKQQPTPEMRRQGAPSNSSDTV